MAVQTAGGVRGSNTSDSTSKGTSKDEVLPGFAVAAVREEGRWRCTALDSEALLDLDSAISELRAVRSPGAVLGLLAVDDCFFVILRPVPGGVSLMISDAIAALDYDIAADVLDMLRIDLPSEDASDDDPWPEGDMGIIADLGLPADELEVLAGELELYPDEQLTAIGRRCGFDKALTELLRGK